jgi:Protein of unknown function (DUF2470)
MENAMTRVTSGDDTRRAARRVCDVLARASSGHVTWLDDADLPSGRVADVRLVIPAVTESPCGHSAPAVVEIADAAPLPVRDRIRCRVRIHGYAAFAPDGDEGLLVRPLAVELEVDGTSTPIDLALLTNENVDPFATAEAAMLSHLANGHPSELGAMRRLLPARLHDARVTPLALDSEGLTLRAESGARHRDVRLSFSAPATGPEDLLDRLQELVRRGRAPHMSALFRSGAAAARLCEPEL